MQVGSSTSNPKMWSMKDDKDFDKAIAKLGVIDSEGKWYKIAFLMPTKTIEELKKRYQLLVDDISDIEAGLVPFRNHNWSATTTTSMKDCHSRTKKERKRGIPWTKEEHELFLLGMEQYGRGDWRSISRYVKSRTPTQVASHAQKYFIHLDSKKKNKKRSSIHDVTIENTGVVSTNQDPITGQQFTNQSGVHVVGSGETTVNQINPPTVHKSSVYGGPTDVHLPGASVYGGQSVGHPPGVGMNGGATVVNASGIGMYGGQFVGHQPGAVPASGTSIIQPPGHHPTYISGKDLHQITNDDVPRFVQNNYYSSF